MPAPYAPPEIVENEDGWGPGNNNIPPHLADVPFAPYGKGDKIGRASDWTLAAYQKYPGPDRCSWSSLRICKALSCYAPRSEVGESCYVLELRWYFSGRYGQQQGPPVFNFFANEEVSMRALSLMLFFEQHA
jgi:hypothetical protein